MSQLVVISACNKAEMLVVLMLSGPCHIFSMSWMSESWDTFSVSWMSVIWILQYFQRVLNVDRVTLSVCLECLDLVTFSACLECGLCDTFSVSWMSGSCDTLSVLWMSVIWILWHFSTDLVTNFQGVLNVCYFSVSWMASGSCDKHFQCVLNVCHLDLVIDFHCVLNGIWILLQTLLVCFGCLLLNLVTSTFSVSWVSFGLCHTLSVCLECHLDCVKHFQCVLTVIWIVSNIFKVSWVSSGLCVKHFQCVLTVIWIVSHTFSVSWVSSGLCVKHFQCVLTVIWIVCQTLPVCLDCHLDCVSNTFSVSWMSVVWILWQMFSVSTITVNMEHRTMKVWLRSSKLASTCKQMWSFLPTSHSNLD